MCSLIPLPVIANDVAKLDASAVRWPYPARVVAAAGVSGIATKAIDKLAAGALVVRLQARQAIIYESFDVKLISIGPNACPIGSDRSNGGYLRPGAMLRFGRIELNMIAFAV